MAKEEWKEIKLVEDDVFSLNESLISFYEEWIKIDGTVVGSEELFRNGAYATLKYYDERLWKEIDNKSPLISYMNEKICYSKFTKEKVSNEFDFLTMKPPLDTITETKLKRLMCGILYVSMATSDWIEDPLGTAASLELKQEENSNGSITMTKSQYRQMIEEMFLNSYYNFGSVGTFRRLEPYSDVMWDSEEYSIGFFKLLVTYDNLERNRHIISKDFENVVSRNLFITLKMKARQVPGFIIMYLSGYGNTQHDKLIGKFYLVCKLPPEGVNKETIHMVELYLKNFFEDPIKYTRTTKTNFYKGFIHVSLVYFIPAAEASTGKTVKKYEAVIDVPSITKNQKTEEKNSFLNISNNLFHNEIESTSKGITINDTRMRNANTKSKLESTIEKLDKIVQKYKMSETSNKISNTFEDYDGYSSNSNESSEANNFNSYNKDSTFDRKTNKFTRKYNTNTQNKLEVTKAKLDKIAKKYKIYKSAEKNTNIYEDYDGDNLNPNETSESNNFNISKKESTSKAKTNIFTRRYNTNTQRKLEATQAKLNKIYKKYKMNKSSEKNTNKFVDYDGENLNPNETSESNNFNSNKKESTSKEKTNIFARRYNTDTKSKLEATQVKLNKIYKKYKMNKSYKNITTKSNAYDGGSSDTNESTEPNNNTTLEAPTLSRNKKMETSEQGVNENELEFSAHDGNETELDVSTNNKNETELEITQTINNKEDVGNLLCFTGTISLKIINIIFNANHSENYTLDNPIKAAVIRELELNYESSSFTVDDMHLTNDSMMFVIYFAIERIRSDKVDESDVLGIINGLTFSGREHKVDANFTEITNSEEINSSCSPKIEDDMENQPLLEKNITACYSGTINVLVISADAFVNYSNNNKISFGNALKSVIMESLESQFYSFGTKNNTMLASNYSFRIVIEFDIEESISANLDETTIIAKVNNIIFNNVSDHVNIESNFTEVLDFDMKNSSCDYEDELFPEIKGSIQISNSIFQKGPIAKHFFTITLPIAGGMAGFLLLLLIFCSNSIKIRSRVEPVK